MMWKCEACDAVYQQWVALCGACGTWRSLVPAPVTAPAATVQPRPRARGQLVTAKQLAAMDRPSMCLTQSWRDLLGSLPFLFGLMAFGPAGAGKSTWLLCLAHELARLGDVLYVAAEEGQSNTMIEKLARLEIHTDRIHVSSAISVSEMLEDLDSVPNCRFLFVDSLSCFPLSPVELSEIVEKRRLGVAFSLHATKSGAYRGTTALAHWVDVVARVEDGVVHLEKNRHGPLKSRPLDFHPTQGGAN